MRGGVSRVLSASVLTPSPTYASSNTAATEPRATLSSRTVGTTLVLLLTAGLATRSARWRAAAACSRDTASRPKELPGATAASKSAVGKNHLKMAVAAVTGSWGWGDWEGVGEGEGEGEGAGEGSGEGEGDGSRGGDDAAVSPPSSSRSEEGGWSGCGGYSGAVGAAGCGGHAPASPPHLSTTWWLHLLVSTQSGMGTPGRRQEEPSRRQ
mmetsp:Transcript_30042/g.76505  ORF Transcript_30042/g.76505 Transcript_30042/m.76505 type:complete len:210 (+) Transcript_30042:934-1563(+)